jgi:hypothetical protein
MVPISTPLSLSLNQLYGKIANFKATDSDVIIAGHCGLPFNKTQDGLLWLNPIGMPANDGNTAVWYMILDENDGEIAFEHQNLHYDFGLTSSLMLDNGLPKEYAKTILSGIWDNMEIPKQKFN